MSLLNILIKYKIKLFYLFVIMVIFVNRNESLKALAFLKKVLICFLEGGH